jgi:hypothetical protein
LKKSRNPHKRKKKKHKQKSIVVTNQKISSNPSVEKCDSPSQMENSLYSQFETTNSSPSQIPLTTLTKDNKKKTSKTNANQEVSGYNSNTSNNTTNQSNSSQQQHTDNIKKRGNGDDGGDEEDDNRNSRKRKYVGVFCFVFVLF